MKFILFLFVLILSTYKTYCQELPLDLTKWTSDGTTLRRYYLIDGDEFTRNYVDYKKWSNSYDWGRAICKQNNSYEIQYYTDGDNIDVSTFGKLKLLTKDDGIFASALSWLNPSDLLCDGGPNYRHFPYTSGMLFSKKNFVMDYLKLMSNYQVLQWVVKDYGLLFGFMNIIIPEEEVMK